jgi:Cu+-exporting ATPase
LFQARKEKGVSLKNAEVFQSRTGKGVTGRIKGHMMALGNRALLEDLSIDSGEMAPKAEDLRMDSKTAMFLAVDGQAVPLLGVADPIKETTRRRSSSSISRAGPG